MMGAKNLVAIWFIMVGVIIAITIVSIFKKNKKEYKINYEEVPETELIKYETMINNCQELHDGKTITKILNIVRYALLIGVVVMIFINSSQILYRIVAVLSLIIVMFLYSFRVKKYATVYKEKIVAEILKSKNMNLEYQHSLGMAETDYRFGNFENFNEYHSEDLITGKLDELSFTLADVLTYRVTRDSDGDTHRTKLFDGSVATLKLNKSINSFIYIIDNKAKLFGSENYVKIDNPEFEETYDVYSDNSILAMRILTPDVTTAILDLMKKLNMYIEIKIYNDIIYFRFHNGGLFEPNVHNIKKEAAGLYIYSTMFDGMQEVMKKIVGIIDGVEL